MLNKILLKPLILSLFIVFIVMFSACGGGNDDIKDPPPPSGTVDVTPPVITLNGESSLTLNQGESYIELGATANDDRDGVVDVEITGEVDTTTIGNYAVTYSATDSANNSSSIQRTVTVIESRPFITAWKTDNIGVSDDNQIKIGTSGSGYDYSVDWGDGVSDEHVTGDITHTYAEAGTYTIQINGDFPQIYFDTGVDEDNGELLYSSHDNPKLISIIQWGDIRWLSMKHAFHGCINLLNNATDAPNLAQVTDMTGMFKFTRELNQNLNNWDVSSVTNMSEMFSWGGFNSDLSSWDVSSVTDMSDMFAGAYRFDQNLSSWEVSAVTDMSFMFMWARDFNQNISNWDVSSVTKMNQMFFRAEKFNQPLNTWDVSSVTNMKYMYYYASEFNQDLSSWDVSSVTDMKYMFWHADTFNQDISNWNVASVIDMEGMFLRSPTFDQDLSSWNISSVTNMKVMFEGGVLSTANYDALLLGWSVQSLQSNVDFGAEGITYSASSQSARDTLTDTFNWTVTDGGVAP